MTEESCVSRKAISEPEMLKVLEACGMFKRYRHRRAGRIQDDPAGAGMSLFLGRRWRDPSCVSDMAVLREGHEWLCNLHPSYKDQCSLDTLVAALKEVVELWAPRNPFLKNRKTQEESECSIKRPLVGSTVQDVNLSSAPKRPRKKPLSVAQSYGKGKAEPCFQQSVACEVKTDLNGESRTFPSFSLSGQQTDMTVDPPSYDSKELHSGLDLCFVGQCTGREQDRDKPLDLFEVLNCQEAENVEISDLHTDQNIFDIQGLPQLDTVAARIMVGGY
eukprot:765726-Hanusia_phi.AAC.3